MRNAVVIFLLAAHLSPADAQRVSILYHETPRETTLGLADTTVRATKPHGRLLSFEAFGRLFVIELVRNERLLIGGVGVPGAIELYRGELAGSPGTWARISRHGAQLSGVIFDGAELYVLEPRHAVARLLAAPSAADGATIVYRWSDTVGTLSDGLHFPKGEEQTSAAALLEHLSAASVSAPKQLDVGFVADFEFSQHQGGAAAAELLAMANIIDGIFAGQTGVFIAVPQLQVFSTSADPFSSADPAALLNQLENHKFDTPALQPLGLAHLFTGRDLEEPQGFTREMVGIANLGGLCDARLGVGLTQATFGTGGSAIIAAHEIGHNFGAPHDAESGSPCSSAPAGYLMEAGLNFNQTFSECSLEQMAPVISAATCLKDVPPNDVSLRFGNLPLTAAANAEFDVEVIVDSEAVNDARRVSLGFILGDLRVLDVNAPTDWSCHVATLPAPCTIDRLPAGRSDTITLTLRSDSSTPSLRAEVVAANDPNTANNRLDHVFTLEPTTDLFVRLDPESLESHLGQENAFVATIRNERFGTATGVNARFDLGNVYDVLEITPSIGSCVQSPTFYDCTLGAIPIGEARLVTVRIAVHDTLRGEDGWELSNLRVEATANEFEAAPDDNVVYAPVVATEAIVDISTSIDGPTHLALGTMGRYAVTYVNNGPEAATDLRLRFDYPQPVDVSIESVAGDGICTLETQIRRIVCTAPVLLPGQSLVLTANGLPTATGMFTFQSISWRREWDRHAFNNTARLDLIVPEATASPTGPAPPAPPPPPASGGGGGGGSSDGVWLAWLLAALALRVSHRGPRA